METYNDGAGHRPRSELRAKLYVLQLGTRFSKHVPPGSRRIGGKDDGVEDWTATKPIVHENQVPVRGHLQKVEFEHEKGQDGHEVLSADLLPKLGSKCLLRRFFKVGNQESSRRWAASSSGPLR